MPPTLPSNHFINSLPFTPPKPPTSPLLTRHCVDDAVQRVVRRRHLLAVLADQEVVGSQPAQRLLLLVDGGGDDGDLQTERREKMLIKAINIELISDGGKIQRVQVEGRRRTER